MLVDINRLGLLQLYHHTLFHDLHKVVLNDNIPILAKPDVPVEPIEPPQLLFSLQIPLLKIALSLY